jgi:hypothetical protein
MGLSSTSGVPHKGWLLNDVIDLQLDEGLVFGEYEDCEFCNQEQIRYVHILGDHDYSGSIRVGCICSCNLTEDYITPKRRERELRNAAARRGRFHDRKWRITKRGGQAITIDRFRVTVGKIFTVKFSLWINSKDGTRSYDELRTAKIRAFDAVQGMKSARNNRKTNHEQIDTKHRQGLDFCRSEAG